MKTKVSNIYKRLQIKYKHVYYFNNMISFCSDRLTYKYSTNIISSTEFYVSRSSPGPRAICLCRCWRQSIELPTRRYTCTPWREDQRMAVWREFAHSSRWMVPSRLYWAGRKWWSWVRILFLHKLVRSTRSLQIAHDNKLAGQIA